MYETQSIGSLSKRRIYRVRPRWQGPRMVVWAFGTVIGGVAYAGYGLHWRWVGINGSTATLWEWMSLLLMPLAFATLPTVHKIRGRLRTPSAGAAAATIMALGCFMAAAYAVPLRWTGWVGNTLWDWMHLLLPPIAVASLPIVADPRVRFSSRQLALAAMAACALAVAILGGYVWGWRWTGFHGSTAWDWLHLLLLPIAIPALVRPMIKEATRGASAADELPLSEALHRRLSGP